MTLRAYAKINLLLRILRKRDDGYHELETLFHPIDLFDEIELDATGTALRCTSDNPALPNDESNLCLRAAGLLQTASGSATGATIRVKKRIPIGAGLGGGSADAAAVLTGLNVLWNTGFSLPDLQRLGLQLGSDVPYFLVGGPAYATGRGEVLAPFDLSLPYWIVVVVPPVSVSTAWAYSVCTPRNEPPLGPVSLRKSLQSTDGSQISSALVNDFVGAVSSSYPHVPETVHTLLQAGALHAQMSGSGSSVYGLFSTRETAESAVGKLPPDRITAITSPSFRLPAP